MHDARQKHSRRTKEQMDELLAAVQGVLDNYDGDRISVRHLCYRLASVGVIAKTERELSGELSFGEYGIRRLKQDIGPPKATPERLTRAKQLSDWLSTSRLYATPGSHASRFRKLLATPSSVS